jgi:autotransporter-associated beta strand protein
MREVYSGSNCFSPVITSTDTNINYGNCYNTSSGGCVCTPSCEGQSCTGSCDHFGAVYTIGANTTIPSSTIEFIYKTNGSSGSNTCETVLAGSGNQVVLNAVTPSTSTFAAELTPFAFDTVIQTYNTTQSVTVTLGSNPSNYPIFYLVGSGSTPSNYTIASGMAFQNCIFWLGNWTGTYNNEAVIWDGGANLFIYGVNNGAPSNENPQWEDNTFVLNYTNNPLFVASNCSVIFEQPESSYPQSYPTNYSDSFLIYNGTATIENSSSFTVTLGGVISESSSSNPGSVVFNASGGQINLTGNNTYSGITTLNSGVIGVATRNAFGTSDIIWNDATLQMIESGFTFGADTMTATINSSSSRLDLNATNTTIDISIIGTSGTLTILDSSGSNTGILYVDSILSGFTGDVVYESGMAVIYSSSNLCGGQNILSGGTLGLGLPAAGTVTVSDSIYLDGSGTIDVFGNGIASSTRFFAFSGDFLDFESSSDFNIINSASSSGAVVFSGNLSYTGPTNISSAGGGVNVIFNTKTSTISSTEIFLGASCSLTIENTITLPAINNSDSSFTGTLVIDTANLITLNSNPNYLDAFIIPSSVSANLSSSGSLNVHSFTATGNLDLQTTSTIVSVFGTGSNIAGVISGSGGFLVGSAGTLSISGGSNTFTGGISLEAGAVLEVLATGNPLSSTGAIQSAGATFISGLSSISSTAASWSLNSQTTTFDCNSVTGCKNINLGVLTANGTTVGIDNVSGANLSFTSLNVLSGNTIEINTGVGGVSIGGLTSESGSFLSIGGTLTINSTTPSTFGGVIQNLGSTSGSINIQSPLTLTASNTFTGNIILGIGGKLTISTTDNLGVSSTIVGSGGMLSTTDFVSLNNDFIFNSGATTFEGNIAIESAAAVSSSAAATLATVGSGVSFTFTTLTINNSSSFSTNGNDILVEEFGSGTGTLKLGVSGNPGSIDTLTINNSTLVPTVFPVLADIGSGGLGVVVIESDVSFPSKNSYSGGTVIYFAPTVTIGASEALGFGTIYSVRGAEFVYENSNLSLSSTQSIELNAVTTPFPETIFSCLSGSCTPAELTNVLVTAQNSGQSTGSDAAILTNNTSNILDIGTLTIGQGVDLYINAGPGISVNNVGSTVSSTIFLDGLLTLSGSTSSVPASIEDYGSPGSIAIESAIVFSGVNTFTGGISFNGAIVSINASNNIPSNGILSVLSGGIENTGNSTVTISNAWNLQATNKDTITLAGALILTGPMTVSGSGSFTIDKGSLTTFPVFSLTSLDIGAGTTLLTNGNNLTVSAFGAGSGILNLGTINTIDTLTIDVLATTTCPIDIIGNGLVVVVGDVIFGGENSFSAGMVLEEGSSITANSNSAFGSASSVITSYGGTINFGSGICPLENPSLSLITTSLIPTTTIDSVGGCSSIPFGIVSTVISTINTGAELINIGASPLVIENLDITNDSLLYLDSLAGVTVEAFSSGAGSLFLSGALTVNNPDQKSTTYSGNIFDINTVGGNVGIIVVSAPLTLSGTTSTFSGGVILNNTLTIGSANSIGTGTITGNGGELVLQEASLSNPWTFNGGNSFAITTTISCASRSCDSISFNSANLSGGLNSIAAIVNNVLAPISFETFAIPLNTTLELTCGAGVTFGATGIAALSGGVGTLAIAGPLTLQGLGFQMNGSIVNNSSAGSLIIDINNTDSLELTATNTFSGGIDLVNGILQVASASNLSSGPITLSGGILYNSSASTVSLSNAFVFNGPQATFSGDWELLGSLTVNNATTIDATGALVLTLSYLDVAKNSVLFTNGHDITLGGVFGSDSGAIALGSSTSTDTLTIDSLSQTTFSGNITNGNDGGGVVVINSNVTLLGNNTFSEGLYLNNATLNIGSSSSSIGSGPITVSVGTIATTGSTEIGNPLDVTADTTLSFDLAEENLGSNTLKLSGSLSVDPNTGSATIANLGPGTLEVTSSASICGTFNVEAVGYVIWNATNTCSTSSVATVLRATFEGIALPPPPQTAVNITVLDGVLRGSGVVTNVDLVHGAVAPGTIDLPNGVLTITEDLTFGEGAVFLAGINPKYSAAISVEGTAYLDSNSYVHAIPKGGVNGSYEHVILSATDIVGQFNDVIIVPDIAFLEANLMYDVPGQISMRVTSVGTGDGHIVGQNARHVAEVLDDIIMYNREHVDFTINCCPVSVDVIAPPVLEDLLLSVRPFINTGKMSEILDQLQPAVFKGLVVVQENNIVQVEQSIQSRIQYLLDAASCENLTFEEKNACCEKTRQIWDFWVDGLGAITSQDSNWYAGSPQVGYLSKMAGFTAGLDAHLAKYFYIGLMGGYTSSFLTFKESRGTGNIETGYAGAYFSAISDMFYGNIHVIGGSNNISGHRYISYTGVHEKAKHTNMGQQLLTHADAGVNIDIMGWFKVRPFDALDYISQTEDSYTEKGAGDWNLKVGKKNAILLRNELGLQLSSCLCFASQKWVINPKFSWVREVRVKGGGYTASFAVADSTLYAPFQVNGYFPDRSLFSPGITLTGSMCEDKFNVELYYNGEFSHGYKNNGFGGQIRVSF